MDSTASPPLPAGLLDCEGTLVQALRASIPRLMAVYAFGSRISGDAGPDSDLDLAVLVEGYADPLVLWELSGTLADLAGCPVDLLDLRAASTVMQHRILTTGLRLWARDVQAGLFESFVLSEKTALDTARAGLLADIAKDGRIHGG
ncbi:type VII toxin-antitoxin system MntA family adenylyltransferase antitoxin [Caldimonas tepidiphila]|uniref:type VII toxin-antitoxin system MntA family adenylyltransferase antitoxin n=1 Tax=Caldimonas tepidiphila TaxID=2315841 RepID=UPI000E5AE063|nr:nucleotidyltransferase domain-containing protein [Caldimonas tepidiphila]